MNFSDDASLLGIALTFTSFFYNANYSKFLELSGLNTNKISGDKNYKIQFSKFIKKWFFLILVPLFLFDAIIIFEIVRNFKSLKESIYSFSFLVCAAEVVIFVLFTIEALVSFISIFKQSKKI